MLIGIIISAVAIAIGVVIGLKLRGEQKDLIEKGYIVKRDSKFAERGTEFCARIGTKNKLAEAFAANSFPCEVSGTTSQAQFNGKKYTARLFSTCFDEASGTAVYRFEFTSWKTYKGMYEDSIGMNRLMTLIENIFLNLDPNTAVKNYPLNLKVKHKLF